MKEMHQRLPGDIAPEAMPALPHGAEIIRFPAKESPLRRPVSTAGYEALMQGEEVSWSRIVREHPMLGTVTVSQMVNDGAIYVIPEYDPATDAVDYKLVKLEKIPQNGNGRH